MILAKILGPLFARTSLRMARWVRPDVVFLGDSITAFWSSGDPWLFRPVRINAGVPGQTTKEMRARFDRDVVARRPRVVHIMGGTNDLWFGEPGAGAAASLAHIAAMVEIAQAAGIAVVLAPPPPIARRARHQFAHLDVEEPLRNGIAALAAERGCGLIDYAEVLVRHGDFGPAFTTDGIHLTPAGYRAMRGLADRAVKSPLP